MEKRITCEICGDKVHVMRTHLAKTHPDISLDDYKEQYPDAPTLSSVAQQRMQEMMKEREGTATTELATVTPIKKDDASTDATTPIVRACVYAGAPDYQTERVALHEVLNVPAHFLKSASGKPLTATAFINTPYPEFVETPHSDYVFDPELVRDCGMAIEENIPAYLYGHAGTGKSTIVLELAARLNRPIIRAQHTGSTEESEILGQMQADMNGTYFEPGLLALAAKYGFIYLADEYDMAFAQVLSTYQAVLEGRPLVIKNASPDWRKIPLHKYFAFVGTGNTNGSGDDTGLYTGTNTQNQANYSRFGISEEVAYLSESAEIAIILSHIDITDDHAKPLVQFASRIRTAYAEHDMPLTIGPRELINAAKVGAMRGDFKIGLRKAFINRLPQQYKDAAEELLNRIYG